MNELMWNCYCKYHANWAGGSLY